MIQKLKKWQERAFTKYLFKQDFIEEGSGRKVYKWRDWVIKVAKNRNGRRQNKLEVERFKKYGKENLAEIIAYSKKIVIMEKVITFYENENLDIDSDKAMALTAWLDKICEVESIDHNDSQGVAKDGRLVCYDYGDSKKTYTKRLAEELSFRELLASKQEDY